MNEEWNKLDDNIKNLFGIIEGIITKTPTNCLTTEQLICKISSDTEVMLYSNCKLLEQINEKLNILFKEVQKNGKIHLD